MINLLDDFAGIPITKGQLLIGWLGLSGYLIKSSDGKFIAIDPYLSDLCETVGGITSKRLMPSLIEPAELGTIPLEALIATHHHEDHLDTETIPLIPSSSATILSTPTSVKLLNGMGIGPERCVSLQNGSMHTINEWEIHAVFADHGELAPDAIGIIIRHGDLCIYHMGDTCFNADEFAKIADAFDIDILLVPINGKFRNMDEIDALKAVQILKPKIVSPMHFWLLPANNGGDLMYFLKELPNYSPSSRIQLFTQGEIFLLDKNAETGGNGD